MNQAQAIKAGFADHPLSEAELKKMRAQAEASRLQQKQAEDADTIDFEHFLIGYLALPDP